MSMKSLNDNKLHEARLFLLGIASNAQDAAHAAEMIKSAGDWYEDEVVRLRALVKSVEFSGSADRCPFSECQVWPGERHELECQGFDESGEVR
jgi:hypothetical protein